MSDSVFHSIATQFRDRYLQPLQFPGSRRSVEQRLNDLENAKNGKQPANPRIKIRTRGQKSQPAGDTSMNARVMTREGIKNSVQNHADIQRVREDHSSNLDNWHAEHSFAASDLLHTFNSRMNDIQGQKKSSTSGGWGAYNGTFRSTAKSTSSPAPAPAAGSGSQSFYNQDEDHGWTSQVGSFKPAGTITPDGPLKSTSRKYFNAGAPKPAPEPARQRVTQPGLFGPSQVAPVRSPQQFGLAATVAPAKSSPSPVRKPRVTQPGLFPKSAVKPPQ